MNELALFAGAGGGILGGKLLGWRTVCAVEYDQYARDILMARQNDGHLEPFPIWDDVRTFDGRPWRGRVDVVSGGFPCQDISSAGKGAGIEGARSGLWGEMARIVSEVRPRFVWVENSPLLVSRGLGLVLSDLASMGYHARWGVVGADDAGAPHIRKRIWILAHFQHTNNNGLVANQKRRGIEKKLRQKQTWQNKAQHSTRAGSISTTNEYVANSNGIRQQGQGCPFGPINPKAYPKGKTNFTVQFSGREEGWWVFEPAVGRVAYGVANRVDRLKCLGNGQVPAVVELAWKILTNLE